MTQHKGFVMTIKLDELDKPRGEISFQRTLTVKIPLTVRTYNDEIREVLKRAAARWESEIGFRVFEVVSKTKADITFWSNHGKIENVVSSLDVSTGKIQETMVGFPYGYDDDDVYRLLGVCAGLFEGVES